MNKNSSGRGCFTYGCLAVLLCILVAGLTFWVTMRWATRAHRIPNTTLSQPEQHILSDKFELLSKTKIEEHEDKVTFTAREINSLISADSELNDNMYVTFLDDALRVKWNMPIPEGVPFWKEKIIRGNLDLSVTLVEGLLDIRMHKLSVMGFSVPNAWLGNLKNKNLAKEYLAGNKTFEAFMRGFKTLKITPEGLILVPSE